MPQFVKNKNIEDEFNQSLNYVESNWSLYLEKQLLNIREVLAQQMEVRGLSRADLAKSLDCSRSYISQLLNGNTNIRLSTLFKVAFSLGVKPRIEYSCDNFDEFKVFNSKKTLHMNFKELETISNIVVSNKIKEDEYDRS
jgi:transcriptional regulator with XRE-family HTH domain